MSEILKPAPYQLKGIEFLKSKKFALLADEMGLGKSMQHILAADQLGINRQLIFGPAISRGTWMEEFEKWSIYGRKWQIIKSQKDCRQVDPTCSVICSYDLAGEFLKHNYASEWDVLGLDEFHFLKSVDAKRSRAILGDKNNITEKGKKLIVQGFCHKAKRTWFYSGTPSPNHAGELWIPLRISNCTPLSYYEFINHFCNIEHTGYGIKILGTKTENIPELKRLLSRIMLRRTGEEVGLQLPPLLYSNVYIKPGEADIGDNPSFIKYTLGDKEQGLKNFWTQYYKEEKTVGDVISIVGLNSVGAGDIISTMGGSVSTLRQFNAQQKIHPLADMIEAELEMKAYDKLVIFAIHRILIEGLRERLKRFGVVTLYGKTPYMKKERHQKAFKEDPKTRVLIGNILTCGINIDLTVANTCIFAESDWVPGNNAQAVKRLHRRGQVRPVYVRFIGIEDSVDQMVTKILNRKTRELAQLYG